MPTINTNILNLIIPPAETSTESRVFPDAPSDSDYFSQEGFDASNAIIAGINNTIENSRRCTIINGSSNFITDKYNSHIIGDAGFVDFNNCFYVACSNGIQCDGDVVSFFSSDERLKDNIIPISGCLDKLKHIDGVEFDWNNNQEIYSGHDIGLIAQQVQKIAPEIVEERKNGYLAVKYEKMVPVLVGAIKEQQCIIQEMQKQINQLADKLLT